LSSPNKTPEVLEQQVVDVRKKLEKQKYSQVGALAVSYEMQRRGIKAPPLRTIERILNRHGLVRKRQKRSAPKGKDYPGIEANEPHEVHQMDIVGPRFIADDGRFYSINIMDVVTGKAAVNLRRQRTHRDVLSSLLDTWQRMSLPAYLQMDNQLPFRGSNRHPHSFGLVIRMCLHLEIQPIFIPLSEPWRNGCIERFQDVFDKCFFRSQRFTSFQGLLGEAPAFELFHNVNHRYSTRYGKTPVEIETASPAAVRRLAEGFEAPSELCIEPGKIRVVRFIRSDAILDVFGLKFQMPQEVVYEYVVAMIDTGDEKLRVFHDNNIVWEQDFRVPKKPIKLK
jgi:transposase InsO family protein